ncbi:GlxA family transcriptional regulator [Pararobbsia silviterrae]|uniref:GlxA family transcriptional regulator n=1 Tax=Pararobbsia silviterrae TaxID=1792498 RepID=A0A494X6R4_9BURK|nr:GlxA family transcriptional regulator [Pararobbsia silviterrae]RKP46120.1 GlxA family transcriptional regulator [Pararobbsia silviterrae]
MHRLGYLLSDGFQLMAVASQAVFEVANKVNGAPFYAIENFSVAGGEVRSSLGMSAMTRSIGTRSRIDTWIVVGGFSPINAPPPADLVAFLRQRGVRARRIAAICTGAFALAEAGLLDGRRATTHWDYAKLLQTHHPRIQVEADRIHIADGPIWTSAGMTAGLDLALAMVETDLGADVARSVAHQLVMHQRRSGGQSQHSELLDLAPKTDRIQNALNYAQQNLRGSLTVDALAEAVNMSPRQFSRVFTEETGQSPAKAIENLRLEAARLMIEQSRHSLDVVAVETGFRDRRHMREVFMRRFGVPPQTIRREVRHPSAARADGPSSESRIGA